MKPHNNFFSSKWTTQNMKPVPGNEYISQGNAEYLTPGQKAFLEQNNKNYNPQYKENQHMPNWGTSAFLAGDLKSEVGFRSNTGQYNNPNENQKGPRFMNHHDSRSSFYQQDDMLELKIQEQEFEFSKMSNVPQGFKLEYVEYNNLPHVSQLNPAFAK